MVITSGEKGAEIACHFANAGSEVLLLTLTSAENKTGPGNKTRPGDSLIPLNAEQLLESMINREPSPLYKKSLVHRIKTGNFHDHIDKIREYDWLIEALNNEDMEVRREVFSKIEKQILPEMPITASVSLTPVSLILKGRSETFKKNFCGIHFPGSTRFNRLLEIIPSGHTGREVIDLLLYAGREMLGKTTLLCKDAPGFIANRMGTFILMRTIDLMKKHGLTIGEADQLTGRLIGREKSATFRGLDATGIDVLVHLGENLFDQLETDEQRALFMPPDWIRKMMKRGWTGSKSGQGFYKKIKMKNGRDPVLVLDPGTMEYKPLKKTKFSSIKSARSKENVKKRIKVLLGAPDQAGKFYRDYFYALFEYMTRRIPEITDELYKIDEALCAGYGWEAGPFEIWDFLGVKTTTEHMEKTGYRPAEWVYELIGAGKDRFYHVKNAERYYYDIFTGDYGKIPGREDILILDDLRKERVVWQRDGASIIDLGEGIINVEFHSKMNTMGRDVIEAINTGLDMAEKDFRGVVIGNQGANFTVGANLGILFMYAIEQEYEDIDNLIRQFQNTIMRARYSKIPVVVATHGLTLGGGCELALHADVVQAFSESYTGLVEVKGGLLPGGGGTKELTRRLALILNNHPDQVRQVQKVFRNIVTAKVSSSAHDAFEMGFLSSKDNISMNRDKLIADARSTALDLAEKGYTMPSRGEKILLKAPQIHALLEEEIHAMTGEGLITPFEKKIAEKIALIMCGGSAWHNREVTEENLLELEREAFLSLMSERKTLERMQAILQGKNPPGN